MSALVEFRGVSFSWPDRQIFDQLSFSIPAGEFVVMVGPNGGGKSTLIRLMLGFLRPQSGSILVMGRAPGEDQSIGYVPQNVSTGTMLPISVESVTLMGRLGRDQRHWSDEDRRCADEALDRLGMLAVKKKNVRELSVGQRQRVLIARAMASRPELLLLDEPLSSVDPRARQSILSALKEASRSCSVMMVSHDLTVIPDCATAVAYVDDGLHYHTGGELTPAVRQRLQCACPIDAAEALAQNLPADTKKEARQ